MNIVSYLYFLQPAIIIFDIQKSSLLDIEMIKLEIDNVISIFIDEQISCAVNGMIIFNKIYHLNIPNKPL